MPNETPTAESSTATVEIQQPTKLSHFTETERNDWRKTGNWPERKAAEPAKEAPAASKESSESAPAPEAGKQPQEARPRQRSNAETRLTELLNDLKASGYTPAELKTLRKAAAAPVQAQTPAASSPAAAPQELKEPVMPKLEDYEGKPMSEYDTAVRKYVRELATFEAQKAIAEDRRARAADEQRQTVTAKLAEARKRYPDWDTVGKVALDAVYADGKAESGAHPAVKHALGISPIMNDLLYVLGGDKELAAFVALSRRDPVAAVLKLGEMTPLIIEEMAKAGKEPPAKGADGKFVSSGPPEKKISSAPKPAAEVGGKGSPPPDALADAQKKGDFDAYRAEANRRDLERRRGR